jgi:hypothetical protein
MRRPDALPQFGEFGARGRLLPAETNRAGGALNVHPIEKQHVEVQVEIERAAKTPNQRVTRRYRANTLRRNALRLLRLSDFLLRRLTTVGGRLDDSQATIHLFVPGEMLWSAP